MSFRSKIFAAMMLLVAGITAATAIVTQQSVESAYRRLSRERFASEVEAFVRARDARLRAVRATCVDLTRSVRLVAAIAEGDPELLYRIALDELRDVLRPAEGDALAPAASFFRFVDAGGAVVGSDDPRVGLLDVRDRNWERQIAEVARRVRPGDQRVGYVAPQVGGRAELLEVVVTAIVDPLDSRRLGTLAIGFPVADPGGGTFASSRGIPSGIWLDGRLHSRTIPEDLGATVNAKIASLRAAGRNRGDVLVEAGGVSHRLFVRALGPDDEFPPPFLVGLYSMSESLARQASLRRRILVSGLVALLVGLGLSFVLAQNLSVPVRELASGTAEIRRGNLDVRVPVRRRDELGDLATSFNEMAEGLGEKERYRSVLNLVADREVARQMVEGRVALGGELRDVTILFCDIRGFTGLSEDMAPTEVIELLNEHMTALTRVVHEHGGVIDKFIGDGLMALYGAPRESGHEAADAIRSAWRMIEERSRLNDRSRYRLDIGIGIASGDVVAGCMGSADRLNYTVLGERVNLAARLCGEARAMEVLIDDRTRERAASLVRVEAAALHLKGFRASVAAWRVLDVVPREMAS